MKSWIVKAGGLQPYEYEEKAEPDLDRDEWTTLELFQVGVTVQVKDEKLYQVTFRHLKSRIFAETLTDLMMVYRDFITPYVQAQAADRQYAASLRR